LGDPVIEINVDPDQIEDCVDDAIQIFQEFHTDATYRTFVKHQVTATDVTNEYIEVSGNIHTITQLLPFNSSSIGGGSGPWSLKYQVAMSDLQHAGTFFGDLQYYEQLGQYISTLDMILTGRTITEYQRRGNRLHIFGEWWDKEIKEGDWLLVEAYVTIDPNTQTSIYNDRFIKDYTTVLIKERWGQNMSKFEGMQLPGGVMMSGTRLISEALDEKEALYNRMRDEYEPMPSFFVG
jgi:hypothetical protein